MSPLDPPVGSLCDTVLAPYAFCDDVPNVVAVIEPTEISNPLKVLVLGLYKN